jgi:hypothetical protein
LAGDVESGGCIGGVLDEKIVSAAWATRHHRSSVVDDIAPHGVIEDLAAAGKARLTRFSGNM